MTSLGKWGISARARTALGRRKAFSVLAVTVAAAAGLTTVAATGRRGSHARRPASSRGTGGTWVGDGR
jgi:hypothetical protein